MMAAMNNLRWGDVDDNDPDLDLPPPVIEGPDENGVRRVTEYRLDDNGYKVKVTTTTRVSKIIRTAAERRAWTKFGDAVGDRPGTGTTMVSTEEVFLERPRAPGSTQEAAMVTVNQSPLMLCRNCGKKGEHWTARCPYQNLTPQSDLYADETLTLNTDGKSGAYVPPSKRGSTAKDGTAMNKLRNDEHVVRITNLSEDTSELDLRELCSYFGPVSCVRVPLSRDTGKCRGLGFVNFVNKEDAERAIGKLNGHGYDNLIISVEWDKSRPN